MKNYGTVVRVGIREEICIVTHNDERGKTITTEVSVNSARRYLEQGMRGLLPVVVMPHENLDGYNPLSQEDFRDYFSGIDSVSYSCIHPDVLMRRRGKNRQRDKRNKRKSRKQRHTRATKASKRTPKPLSLPSYG